MSEFAEAAVRYAKLGLAVIPLLPREKKPIFRKWPELASSDIDLVTRWWKQNPDSNVGILTGQRSGCFVLDVDGKNGGVETYESLIYKYGQLPDTWRDMTGGAGGGFHLYFRYPNFDVGSPVGIFPGIDIRGNGSQVVAPPSIHPETGNRYEWDGLREIEQTPMAEAPLWLLEALQGKVQPAVRTERPPLDLQIQQGVRHDTFVSLAGLMRKLGLTSVEMAPTLRAVNSARCAPPCPTEEIDGIAESMMRYQPGDRDLITTAGRLWRLTKARELEQRERQARLTVQTVDGLTIYREPAPDQRCVVESLLYHGLTILAGRPKTGKSFLALQLALSVSQGTDFLKARPILRPGRVLYVALEEAQARTSVRMRKFQHSESVLLQNISMLYQLLPMMDGGIEQLDETMRVQTPNLVILDTFLAFVGMSAAGRDVLRSEYREVQALHTLAEKHDTAILVVHHTRKPTIGGNGLDAVAGSTGITAAADAVWTVERQDVGVCSLDIVGREAEEQTLALRFGQDDGWELEGTGERVKAMKDEREILTLLRNEAPLSAGRIATLLRMNANRTRSILYDLHQRGVVAKNTGGSFRLSEGGGNDAN